MNANAMRSPLAFCALLLLLLFGCARDGAPRRPNLLLVVWDTVRADRIGVYGHALPTTPSLDRWAERGRVYDAMSPSCWTIPSHATMFTGLLPTEHALVTHDRVLDPAQPTLADRLRAAGYQTYAFSANPHVSARTGLTRGFERAEHPFDPQLRARAQQIVAARIQPEDRNPEVRRMVRAGRPWGIKAVGELVNERFAAFLDARDTERPFFAFLNYMEAHRVRLPPRALRDRVMPAGDAARSYTLDQSQELLQRITFGLAPPYGEAENAVIRGVYDASLAELDLLFDALLRDLDARGLLDETVVVLTSDHGEHLGEHGSYLHQFSLHEGLLRVPLVVWAPAGFPAGREPVPVSSGDVFPTLLELAGLEVPAGLAVRSLQRPEPGRALIAEYPAPYAPLLTKYPDLDPTPFSASLEVVRVGPEKLLRRSDGRAELFDVDADPGEQHDLTAAREGRVASLSRALDRWHLERRPPLPTNRPAEGLSDEEAERLRALGYL
jgi:arylsulfatase A-like enzyme